MDIAHKFSDEVKAIVELHRTRLINAAEARDEIVRKANETYIQIAQASTKSMSDELLNLCMGFDMSVQERVQKFMGIVTSDEKEGKAKDKGGEEKGVGDKDTEEEAAFSSKEALRVFRGEKKAISEEIAASEL